MDGSSSCSVSPVLRMGLADQPVSSGSGDCAWSSGIRKILDLRRHVVNEGAVLPVLRPKFHELEMCE